VSGEAPILQVRGLRFAYGDGPQVLGGVDLTAAQGELLCILGPNGSGKSTFLKCVLGLLDPTAGKIELAGKSRRRYRAIQLARIISYVPQTARAAFSFTVEQVVMMGRTPHMGHLGLAGELDKRVVAAAMEMTGVTALAARPLESLSGGEQQTVMITRALAQQPRLMLLDEPTSHLDVRHQLDIYALMAKLAHDWGMAVMCVSHDVNMAGRFADRLALLSGGCLAAYGSPHQVIQADVLSGVYGVGVRLVDVGLPVPMVVAGEAKPPAAQETKA
jgi:iron complex transport system ATP-binding protein